MKTTSRIAAGLMLGLLILLWPTAYAQAAELQVLAGGGMTAPLKELGADPVTQGVVTVREGRFGPYVTDGETNASLRKDDEIESLTDERAAELLADRRARGPVKKKAAPRKAAKKAPAKKAAKKPANTS